MTQTDRNQVYFEDQDADIADSTHVFADGAVKNIAIWGDFGSGTATLEGSPDGGTTWIVLKKNDGTDAAYTAAVIDKIDVLKTGMQTRVVLSGSTSPDLNARLF